MRKVLAYVRSVLAYVRSAAGGYEPAVVSSIVAASFVLAAGLGITVGDLPEKANAVLTFLAFIAPIVAGKVTRSRVRTVKSLRETGVLR